MQVPLIHLNGTSKEQLLEAYMDARNKLFDALAALAATSPNARDYYPRGNDAFTEASNEHAARMYKLREVRDEINLIVEALLDE